MPWKSLDDLPASFANLPTAAKQIALKVLNATIDQGDEAAIKAAWGAIKRAGYAKRGDQWVKVAEHHLQGQHDQGDHGKGGSGKAPLTERNAVEAAKAWAASESMSGGERRARSDLIHRAQYMTPEAIAKSRKMAGDGMARRTAARVKNIKGDAEEAQAGRDRVQAAADGLKEWGDGKRPAAEVVQLIAAAKRGTTGHLLGSLEDDEKWMRELATKGYAEGVR